MKFGKALDIKSHEVISLVGAGGKTSLMFTLAQELASNNKSVITTTTTKILEPSSSDTSLLLLETDEEKMIELLLQNLDKHRHITLATERLPSGKLKGISPRFVMRLADLNEVSYIIVEADGAAGKPLKAPNSIEPVIPENTSLLIPIVGIDALGCRLTEEAVFRPEIVSRLTGLSSGDIISAEAIAILITHSEGIIRGSQPHVKIVPFINKVDLDGGLPKARGLAYKVLGMKHPQIERVILGQTRFPEPAVEVISTIRSQGGEEGYRC